MAQFTPLEAKDIQVLVEKFPLGELEHFAPITTGTQNTSYFVDTQKGSYVLTLVEIADFPDIDYYVGLVDHLYHKGFPCAQPIRTKKHTFFTAWQNKPVIISQRLQGHPLRSITLSHCHEIGELLGRLHNTTADFKIHHHMDLEHWCRTHAKRIIQHLDPASQTLMRNSLELLTNIPWQQLPQGSIHGDFFPDNVLFHRNQLQGVIDFFHAANASLLYDLSVARLSWCFEGSNNKTEGMALLLEGYQQQRPLETVESSKVLAHMDCIAALRFWISRLCNRILDNPSHAAILPEPIRMQQHLNYFNQQLSSY